MKLTAAEMAAHLKAMDLDWYPTTEDGLEIEAAVRGTPSLIRTFQKVRGKTFEHHAIFFLGIGIELGRRLQAAQQAEATSIQ